MKASSYQSNIVVAAYLTKYRLFTVKYLNYIRWLEVNDIILRGEHLSAPGLLRCAEIKSDFNTTLSPKNISLHHLSNLYI